MAALMVYGLVVASFLAAATFFLDRGLRNTGRSTRWVWALAMLAAVGLSLAPAAGTGRPPAQAGSTGVPVDVLYELLAAGEVPVQSSGASQEFNGPLLLLWLLGSASLLLAACWAYHRLHRAAGKWERRSLGRDEVLVSEGLGPAVLGLIRPVIVIPPWVLDLSREKQELILLHEREHQTARDPALLLLGLFLVAAVPWNPALWWMARRLHLALEGDCDARVLAQGVTAQRYGNLLLEVASGGGARSVLSPALAEGGETFLERRLLMIRSAVRKKSLFAAVVPLLLGAGFLALACETPTPPTSGDPELTLETPTTAATESSQGITPEASPVPTEISEAKDGYYLIRKNAGKYEYVRPLSEDQLQLIHEEEGDASGKAFLVRHIETGSPSEVQEDHPLAPVIRVRKNPEDASGTEGPEPLIIVDGVIVSDPNFMETLDKESIDRIEITKGEAAKALYGERAAGGVIQIFTKH